MFVHHLNLEYEFLRVISRDNKAPSMVSLDKTMDSAAGQGQPAANSKQDSYVDMGNNILVISNEVNHTMYTYSTIYFIDRN